MNNTPLLYIAGPYSANKLHTEQVHILRAEAVSIELIRQGFHVITPHKNTSGYEKYENDNINFDTWIEMDLNIIKRCDALYLMDGWIHSNGAIIEARYAWNNDIYVFMQSLYPTKELTLKTYYDVLKISDKYKTK